MKLSLSSSFETILGYYRDIFSKGCKSSKKPVGRSIIIISNKARPSIDDMDMYKKSLSLLKDYLPDINILYALTTDIQKFFHDLPNRYLNDSFLNISDNIDLLSTSIAKRLQRIPGQIVNVYCNDSYSKLEDYLTPGIERIYEIHDEYNMKYDFEITVSQ